MTAVTERSQFSTFIIALVFALVACAPSFGQTSPDYELQKQWETPFGLFRNWVLCPDGSLYSFADKSGAIKRISAAGKIDPEKTGAIALPASLLTCDEKDQLYIASGKNFRDLDVYSLDAQQKLARSVSAREKFFLGAAVVTPDGNLYVLSETDSAPVIRQLSPDGRVLHKFPAGHAPLLFPFLLLPYPLSWSPRSRVFDWDQAHQRFVVDTGRFLSLESMDLKGHWQRVNDPFIAGYSSPALNTLDRMFAWKGQYIAELTFKSEIADVFNVTKLEVLDQSFRAVWSRTVTAQDGLLVGVAADGSLYFLGAFNGTDCKLARYTLAQVGQAATN